MPLQIKPPKGLSSPMKARSKCSEEEKINRPKILSFRTEAKRNVPAEEEQVLSLHKENKVLKKNSSLCTMCSINYFIFANSCRNKMKLQDKNSDETKK